MLKLPVYNTEGDTVGEITLSDQVFGAPVNDGLMHRAVVMYLANQRVGTAATKTRANVRGGGRKPWRQKGLGRARHGSIRSPIWRGGGVTFGPQPRDYRQAMPKKARRGALRSALSAKTAGEDIKILDDLIIDQPRTREIVRILGNLGVENGKPLIITADQNEHAVLAARNLPDTAVVRAGDLNTYTVLRHGNLIMTQGAVAVLEEVLVP